MNKNAQKPKKKNWWSLPTKDEIKNHKHLSFIKEYLHDHALWHFNSNSVPKAMLIGIFMSFMPMPFQMIPAAILAVLFTANIILSIALVWISNPITMPAMLYGSYKFGKWLLHSNAPQIETFDWDYLLHQLTVIWKPLLLGSVLLGLIFGIIGYMLARLFYLVKHNVKT